MNITMLHELDTGFMAATLKPAFQSLGHTCTIVQGWDTFLESDTSHIDHLLKDMPISAKQSLVDVFKETDLFIVRAGDQLMRETGALPYLNQDNMVYRLHGHDLTALGRPYALRSWRINWHGKEPFVVTYKDPTFLPHLQTPPIYIERPINLSIIPRKRRSTPPFALSSPSGMVRKGPQALVDIWKKGPLELKVISHTTREEVLALKSKASFFIDNVSTEYKGGPYGMNSVEAWLLGIPVFSQYSRLSEVVCPQLPNLVHNVSLETVQQTILDHIPTKKALSYTKHYALSVHDPIRIAKQYISLGITLSSLF